MKKKSKVNLYLIDLGKKGLFDKFCERVNVSPSYMRHRLQSGKFRPSEQVIRSMAKCSRGKLVRADLDVHFSKALN